MALSDKDVQILRALQNHPDDSRQELADRLGMSVTTLWRRINDLQAEGLIKGTAVLLDPEKTGLPVCVFVFINLKDYSPETRNRFEDFVTSSGQIMECYSVTGAYDYTLLIRSRSVSDFERFLMDEILSHPGVESASSQIALRQNKYNTALPV